MFLEDVFLESVKNDLAGLVSRPMVSAIDRPYRWDPYVAKSQLQKGIRRGDVQNALIAARFLLQVNEKGFWRRLCIIALEDVGVAKRPFDLTAASGRKGGLLPFSASANQSCRNLRIRHSGNRETGRFSAPPQGGCEPETTGPNSSRRAN